MKKYHVILMAVVSAFLFGGYSYESIPPQKDQGQTSGLSRLAQAEEFSFIQKGSIALDPVEGSEAPSLEIAPVEDEEEFTLFDLSEVGEEVDFFEGEEAGYAEEADPYPEDDEEEPLPEEAPEEEEEPEEETKDTTQKKTAKKDTSLPDAKKKKKALKQAAKQAAQYDYQEAISTLRSVEHYKNDEEIVEQIRSYKDAYKACKPYPLENITHVFFHSLVVDASRAFDGDYNSAGYNQVMTTVKEFRKILEIMYTRGYVLVSPHDMAYKDENGLMQRGEILLPEGKIPFVLSQDDVSYYHYMDGDGLASRLVLDEKGKVKCEYLRRDGAVVVGDYDMVPILDTFVKEHPDFSYHGRKGILAMTGYNGVLGYRTDKAYRVREELDELQTRFLEEHPDFDFEKEVEQARAVAEAMKKDGWEFASHTWGHQNATTASVEELIADDVRFKESVVPVLGETDMIIFAFGADIGNWDPYTYDNPKFSYYKGAGYDYFCNVDSSQYWVQITGDFFRQGRRNLDGYRMYYNPEMLSDLFDVSLVWDKARPVPVPPM